MSNKQFIIYSLLWSPCSVEHLSTGKVAYHIWPDFWIATTKWFLFACNLWTRPGLWFWLQWSHKFDMPCSFACIVRKYNTIYTCGVVTKFNLLLPPQWYLYFFATVSVFKSSLPQRLPWDNLWISRLKKCSNTAGQGFKSKKTWSSVSNSRFLFVFR